MPRLACFDLNEISRLFKTADTTTLLKDTHVRCLVSSLHLLTHKTRRLPKTDACARARVRKSWFSVCLSTERKDTLRCSHINHISGAASLIWILLHQKRHSEKTRQTTQSIAMMELPSS